MEPIIGIVIDYETKKKPDGGYANYPWYALRYHYSKAIKNSGGMPIMLPYESQLVDHYLELCHGILIPGGGTDIPPHYYAEDVSVNNISLSTDTSRIDFELALIKQALKLKIPILGVCAGQQSLNVTLGGTLYQDIKEQLSTKLNHSDGYHKIEVVAGTLLHKIAGRTNYLVNTFHHQAVKALGHGLIASALAPDGVVECVEHNAIPFCIGVAWHPEFLDCKEDVLLFQAFIKAANQYKLDR